MNLHLRLTARYAAVLLAALLVLAGIALGVMDRVLRSGLDARLQTEGYAAAQLIETARGNVVIDADDRPQFLTLTSGVDQGIVTDRKGKVVLSTEAVPPDAIQSLALESFGFRDVGAGEDVARVCIVPIVRAGIRAGSVVVWRASDWIEETERGMAFAFFGAAVVIAVLSWGVGALLTRGALNDAFARQRRFTADASHELRAPLAVIRAEADLALRKERTPQEYRSSLASIAAETDRLEQLTSSLLSAARAQQTKARHERFEAAAAIRSARERLLPLAETKRVSVVVSGASPLEAIGDPSEIERALVAVMHNAIKFSAPGTGVSVAAQRAGKWIEIAVDDEGPGFSHEALRHAFEPFWRGGVQESGAGLGLAIVHAVVKASGGSVDLVNRANGGRVLLRIPAAS